MMLSPHARILYHFLTRTVHPTRKVITYGELSRATGIPLGTCGGSVGLLLGEIFRGCDLRRLPPLTAIVVGEGGLYDPTRCHAMPSIGYFREEAASPNRASRERMKGIERWGTKPPPPGFDPDLARWEYQAMVEHHQDRVWSYPSWPAVLDDAEDDAQSAWRELEQLWNETSIDSGGVRLTRDQLHERP